MNKKSKAILILLAFAAALFCLIQFWIIPGNRARKAEYAVSQRDALTHRISAVQGYRSPYVGDSGNTCGLFEVLPLNDVERKFEIDSDSCTLTVHYLDAVWNIGEEKVQRDLLYNAAAAMAAIDNLEKINFCFSGSSYSFEREEIENAFGSPLSGLLLPEVWSRQVQNRLSSRDFCRQFYE